jgi:hypothetical protein
MSLHGFVTNRQIPPPPKSVTYYVDVPLERLTIKLMLFIKPQAMHKMRLSRGLDQQRPELIDLQIMQ